MYNASVQRSGELPSTAVSTAPPPALKVLSVAPECYPLAKTGGLADVVGALPPALAPLGVDMRVLMPGYPGVRKRLRRVRELAGLDDLFGGSGTLLQGLTAEGTEVLLLQAAHLYDRVGGPYLDPDGTDWPDNHLRFGALSWVAAEIAFGRIGDWHPQVVHLHDWQSALTAAYLRFGSGPLPAPPTLLTIHNLAFQGLFPMAIRAALRLPAAAAGVDGMEYWGNLSFLKAGVLWSDHLSTVSPTYAREILGPDEGMGWCRRGSSRAGSPSCTACGTAPCRWSRASGASPTPWSTRTRQRCETAWPRACSSHPSMRHRWPMRSRAPSPCSVSRGCGRRSSAGQ